MRIPNAMKSIVLILVAACINLTSAHAFEITTHAKITSEAWARFLTENPGVLDRLGIQDKPNAFGTNGYYDYRPTDGTAPFRMSSVGWYEDTIMGLAIIGIPNLSVPGWLVRGAIREDDDSDASDPSPKDDPYGNFHRVFSHFHDPANNRGLTVGITLGAKAADWALDPIAITPVFGSSPARNNHFNLATFRESMWRAATGLNQAGVPVAPTASERNLYWATAFRTLGDILHLNQDMAQPQHTRNDPHAGGSTSFVTGHKSVLERYLDARIKDQRGFSTKDDATAPNVSIVLPPFNSFGGYRTPEFTRFADYWATPQNKGLANYSNRGFFSIGTLPGSGAPYASPSTDVASYAQQSETLTRWDGSPVLGGLLSVKLYVGDVPDAQLGSAAPGVPLFAESVWDEAAQGVGGLAPGIRLVKRNYDAAIDLLIPRAVAYSAGILQYAFRGRLNVSLPVQGVYALADHSMPEVNTKDTGGFRTIKLKVKNVTPPLDVNGQPTTETLQATGALRAVVKFRRNACYEPQKLLGQPGAPGYGDGCKSTGEEIALSEPVTPTAAINTSNGEEITFNFQGTQNVIPINATDVYLQVVYRGPLGEETDAVVVATKDISEPSLYDFDNYSDCQRNADGTYSTVTGFPLTASMSFNNGATYNASVSGLAPGRYSRFALLADNYFVPVLVQDAGGNSFEAIVNQDGEQSVPNPTPIQKARPTVVPPGGDNNYMYAYDGFGFYPYQDGSGYLGAQGCPTPVNAVPVPMTINF